jgi:uncharacterized protein (TIGR00369 family)
MAEPNDDSGQNARPASHPPPARQPFTSTAVVSLAELVNEPSDIAQSGTLPSAHVSAPSPSREIRERRDLPSSQNPPAVSIRMAPRLPPPSMLTLRAEVVELAAPRLVRVRYPVDEAFSNPYGALQSGFLAAMFDNVIGMCAYAIDPNRPSATLELSVRYFRAISVGHVLIDGTVLRAGRTTLTIECIARDDAGELCAKATATNLFVE